MAVFIGLLVAASFGSGDFLGGIASRRAATVAVLATAQFCALVGAVVVAVAAGGDPTVTDLALGAAAGLLSVVALGSLFQGLAIGQIGQVAPLAAMVGAVIPVGWALLTGERPSPVALAGVVLAVVAGGLISRERVERQGPRVGHALLLALVAGLGFGTSFICLASTTEGSGFWPVLSTRAAAVAGVLVVAAISGTGLRLERVPRWQAIGAGAFDVGGITLLLIAVRGDLAATVAPVAALAPGFTVIHAWWYLKEPASKVQVVGLVLALIGLVLIAVG